MPVQLKELMAQSSRSARQPVTRMTVRYYDESAAAPRLECVRLPRCELARHPCPVVCPDALGVCSEVAVIAVMLVGIV